MSRSYKKHSWCGDHKGTGKKRTAWKTVRQWQKDHPDILLQGGAYKKIYETWDICDYHWYEPKSEAIKDFETKRFKYGPDTLEEAINDWKKYYYRK